MNPAHPHLFASPETANAVREARAAIVLIGSYDGSGNYGDIAQFDAALALAERLGPGILALPVLERRYLASHRELCERSGTRAPLPIFFDPEGGDEDGLLPLGAPVELAFGAIYLYGGGYLNRRWGARKLEMLDAAEALLAGGGALAPCRVASGLQVESGWVESGAAPALERFELLGARDSGSWRALDAIAGDGAATATGDDAIGLLTGLPTAASPAAEEPLRLNLHFAEHEWMSDQPAAVLDLYAGLVAELGRLAGRPVRAQPLIAYLDDRIDERVAIARLREACAAPGVTVAEPLLLRPAELDGSAPELARAELTLSCSYHVALTSLMLEVPAVLVGDNAYYQQKAAGLREDFQLPPAFTIGALADPVASAAEIGAVLFDPGRAAALRGGLAAAAERQRQRRATAEAELLGRLGAAAAAALAERIGEQAERLRQRTAEPAELRARLAALEAEREEAHPWDSPLEAELRVQAAEGRAAAAEATATTVLQSRSWRLLSPLRRIAATLRRG